MPDEPNADRTDDGGEMTLVCSYCGAETPLNSTACISCGKKPMWKRVLRVCFKVVLVLTAVVIAFCGYCGWFLATDQPLNLGVSPRRGSSNVLAFRQDPETSLFSRTPRRRVDHRWSSVGSGLCPAVADTHNRHRRVTEDEPDHG